jgi:signal transduction histidine kinase
MLEAVTGPAEYLYAVPVEFRAFLDSVRAAGAVLNRELEMVRDDGRRIWVSHGLRCVPDSNDTAYHFEGFMEDVTERRRAAQEMRTLNAGLEKALHELKATQEHVIQQERLRALGEMASGVAHDFNNALTPIMGYTELMIRHGAELNPGEFADNLKTIHTAAADAATVVSRLREFYRTTSAGETFQAVDLNLLAGQTVTLTQPRWKDQARSRGVTIEVVTDLQERACRVDGEAAALREMLTNMVFNAVDAMPEGGTITLRTRSKGERSIIEVSDTGTGMTAEVRRHCLEPFFSTKGEKGTGLGLSMCFGIIQRHRGTIDIRTKIGKGTTFVMSFPVSEAPPEPVPAAAEDACAGSGHRSLRVLVVDDEKPIRVLLGTVLKGEGHEVSMAEDGPGALQLFGGADYDLVITDKSMPGMNGDQLATAIKQSSPRTPIILLTGFGQFLDRAEVPDVDFIASKPISLESLREAITAATSTCQTA